MQSWLINPFSIRCRRGEVDPQSVIGRPSFFKKSYSWPRLSANISYSSRDSATWVVIGRFSTREHSSASSYIFADAVYGACGLRPNPPSPSLFSEKNNQDPKAISSIQGLGRTSISSRKDQALIGGGGSNGNVWGVATISKTVVTPFLRSSSNPSCVARR